MFKIFEGGYCYKSNLLGLAISPQKKFKYLIAAFSL